LADFLFLVLATIIVGIQIVVQIFAAKKAKRELNCA
jgi:hypothetical protein